MLRPNLAVADRSMNDFLRRKSLPGKVIHRLRPRGHHPARRGQYVTVTQWSTYSGVLPDKISIFGGPITRLAAGDADRLRREVRHVVLHEIAHHFGISDERLIELDRY